MSKLEARFTRGESVPVATVYGHKTVITKTWKQIPPALAEAAKGVPGVEIREAKAQARQASKPPAQKPEALA